ncbi:Ark- serine/threonine protein kinase [Dispira simplex]|nr:Ark- serine/threonine protein kinase [Dispira simplex]
MDPLHRPSEIQDEEYYDPSILPPGTTKTVGNYHVTVQRLLTQGVRSHIYLVEIQSGPGGTSNKQAGDRAILKRTVTNDSEEREHRIMQQVSGHPYIIQFFGSATEPLGMGQGYETFILMEYCPAGSLVDLLNRRRRTPLEEREILRIFSQVCQAVAHLHYQTPPVIHRDLKVENILIASDLSRFVLCDFGSCTQERVLVGTALTRKQATQYEEDIQRHTTLEYRAPELIDLYLKQGLTEKMDIWALGILLYKLCYYRTPFEDMGELAILNSQYTLPDTPEYSSALRGLVDWMLQEEPLRRPDIYQLTARTFELLGQPCPITNRYQGPAHFINSGTPPRVSTIEHPAGETPAYPRSFGNQQLSSLMTPDHRTSSEMDKLVGEEFITPVTPMRRGRPTRRGDSRGSGSAKTNQLPNLSGFSSGHVSTNSATAAVVISTNTESPAAAQDVSLWPELAGSASPTAQSSRAAVTRQVGGPIHSTTTDPIFGDTTLPEAPFVTKWPSPTRKTPSVPTYLDHQGNLIESNWFADFDGQFTASTEAPTSSASHVSNTSAPRVFPNTASPSKPPTTHNPLPQGSRPAATNRPLAPSPTVSSTPPPRPPRTVRPAPQPVLSSTVPSTAKPPAAATPTSPLNSPTRSHTPPPPVPRRLRPVIKPIAEPKSSPPPIPQRLSVKEIAKLHFSGGNPPKSGSPEQPTRRSPIPPPKPPRMRSTPRLPTD